MLPDAAPAGAAQAGDRAEQSTAMHSSAERNRENRFIAVASFLSPKFGMTGEGGFMVNQNYTIGGRLHATGFFKKAGSMLFMSQKVYNHSLFFPGEYGMMCFAVLKRTGGYSFETG